MSIVRSYGDLVFWQKAMDLVVTVYKVTEEFPRSELYGLTSQIRRAVIAVPSNIAEGHARTSTTEFLHHISIARGSLSEVETQVLIAERLSFLPANDRDTLMRAADEVGRLLRGLTKSLQDR